MTPQEDNDAPERLSTKDIADTVGSLFVCLGSSTALAYFLVFGEPRFDQIHTKYGVPPEVSEIALWCVTFVVYVCAIIGAWALKSKIKPHRLKNRCAFLAHQCVLVFAVLLSAPACLVALLIALLIVIPFLWEKLNSQPAVVWLFIGFLIWQRWIVLHNYKKFLAITNILTDIQQSVRNIEKDRIEPKER